MSSGMRASRGARSRPLQRVGSQESRRAASSGLWRRLRGRAVVADDGWASASGFVSRGGRVGGGMRTGTKEFGLGCQFYSDHRPTGNVERHGTVSRRGR